MRFEICATVTQPGLRPCYQFRKHLIERSKHLDDWSIQAGCSGRMTRNFRFDLPNARADLRTGGRQFWICRFKTVKKDQSNDNHFSLSEFPGQVDVEQPNFRSAIRTGALYDDPV